MHRKEVKVQEKGKGKCVISNQSIGGLEAFSPRKFFNLGLEIYLKLPRAMKFIIALQNKKKWL